MYFFLLAMAHTVLFCPFLLAPSILVRYMEAHSSKFLITQIPWSFTQITVYTQCTIIKRTLGPYLCPYQFLWPDPCCKLNSWIPCMPYTCTDMIVTADLLPLALISYKLLLTALFVFHSSPCDILQLDAPGEESRAHEEVSQSRSAPQQPTWRLLTV